MSEPKRSTLTRTEETLMNACVATTALSLLLQRVFFALMQGEELPSRATTTMSRDSRPSLTAYEKEGEK
ncbi:unnamed protein product [Sphagnum troendelagicum]|uniref:Uncharacterized protein n=1 Tax=Sphagnum jensenii TaxID=128206 RepID=A0ABP0WQY0_9BRYO